MNKTGVFPVKNNVGNLTGVMCFVDTTTKQPLVLQNNVFGNFVPSNFASRKSFNDEASSDRKGKRKIVNEIDFFSSEKRKMPKLESGSVSSPIPLIKEEDITLQIGLQFTENEEKKLQQANKRMADELAVAKAKLQQMTEEINGLKNMMATNLRDHNYYYPIALLHKGHQGNPVIPSQALKRMILDKQHRENYQVLETHQKLPRI